MIRFKHPFTCIVAGPSCAGKSTFCIRFLKNLESVSTEFKFAGGIVWCYSEKNAVPEKYLKELKKKIKYHEGVPDAKYFANLHGQPTLVILDDLLNEAYSQAVSDLFTRGSHYRNISVFLITQNLFQKAQHARTISLNAKYMVALKNIRDQVPFVFLARQIFPKDSDGLYKAYLDATEKPHGYMVLDLTQDTDNLIRFRTRIFPEEYPPLIYAPVGNEKDKIEIQAKTHK
jgi:GTPase SAR1 family protein